MTNRSSLAEVRNPILALPSYKLLLDLDPAAQDALQAILADLSIDAAARAEKAWDKSKGPMAAYWKAVSVYAKHIRAATRRARAENKTHTPQLWPVAVCHMPGGIPDRSITIDGPALRCLSSPCKIEESDHE